MVWQWAERWFGKKQREREKFTFEWEFDFGSLVIEWFITGDWLSSVTNLPPLYSQKCFNGKPLFCGIDSAAVVAACYHLMLLSVAAGCCCCLLPSYAAVYCCFCCCCLLPSYAAVCSCWLLFLSFAADCHDQDLVSQVPSLSFGSSK